MDSTVLTGHYRWLIVAGLALALPSVVFTFAAATTEDVAAYSSVPTASRVHSAAVFPPLGPFRSLAGSNTAVVTPEFAHSAERRELSQGIVPQMTGLAFLAGGLSAIVFCVRLLTRSRPAVLEPLTGMLVECSRDRVAIAPTSGQKAGGRRHAFALVVNNKGGGHGEIGLHLALALRAKGLEVQLINDNGGKDISAKVPFSEYAQLAAAGVEVTYADLSQPGGLQSATCPPGHLCRAYDYVFDNQNVCQKEVADLAASCGAFYTYVSSGGMYIPGDKFPMKEGNPSKGADANAQKKHEEYVMSSVVRPLLRGCAFFRPQYIVGPYTNKRDYLDWYFDRLTRNLPIPLPAPGTQTTTITDVRDVASMLAAVVDKRQEIDEAEKANPALGPVFNCASDRPVTLRELAVACGAACGKTESQVDALIRLYDPKLAKDAPSGGKFPFRATNFDVCVMKAKVVLEWEPEYNDLEELAAGYYLGYKALGLDKSNPKFDRSFDEYILARL